MIEANLLRVAAELPVEPVGSRPERMPDGSIAADDHRVLQQPPHGPTSLVRNGRQLERRANQRRL